ncbi:MAG: helix-turn-helix transcriptional regulator [Solirubrobacterales bacterium]|nr:helix-turn-helix transcriptional regulator [Solirubrobacterales bacterium]
MAAAATARLVEPPAVREQSDPLSHPARHQIDLAAVLHALSDPMRLRIVSALAFEDRRTCKSFNLPVTKSTCTHHFRVLREAGVIQQRLEGTTRLNSLRREDLDARFPGLLDSVLRAAGAASADSGEAGLAHAPTGEAGLAHAPTGEAGVAHASTGEAGVAHAPTGEAGVAHAPTGEAGVA